MSYKIKDILCVVSLLQAATSVPKVQRSSPIRNEQNKFINIKKSYKNIINYLNAHDEPSLLKWQGHVKT